MAVGQLLSKFLGKLSGEPPELKASLQALQRAVVSLQQAQATMQMVPMQLQKAQDRLSQASLTHFLAPSQETFLARQQAVGDVSSARAAMSSAGQAFHEARGAHAKAQEQHQMESSGLAPAGRALGAAGSQFGSAFGALSKGAGASKVGEHLLNAGASIATMFGPSGMVAGAVLKFGSGLLSTNSKLNEWGNSLRDANLKLSEWSGSMAMANMEHFIRQSQLDIRKGELLAPSAKALEEARDERNKAAQPVENMWQKVGNKILTEYYKMDSAYQKFLTKNLGLDVAEEEQLKQNSLSTGDWMDKLGLEQWYEKYGRPPRFNP